MRTKQKSGAGLFREWYTERLGNLHYEALGMAPEPSAAFQTMGYFGDEPIYPDFERAWKRRFGLQLNVPVQPEHSGWYLMYMGIATIVVSNMLIGARVAKFQGHVELAQTLRKRLHACYSARGYRGQQITDSTLALVRFEARGDCDYLTVVDACLPHIQGPLAITKPAGVHSISGGYRISDETGQFSFALNGPQTAEFQRACLVFFDHPVLDPREFAPEAFPVLMSWIFADGYQNVIYFAESALSHQHGVTYSAARRVLRMAQGIGLPPASERL